MSVLVQQPSRRVRCARCQRPEGYCLCALIPALQSQTQLLILQHPDEARHALNTARLVALGLSSATLQTGTLFPEYGAVAGRFLLFPSPDAVPLTALSGTQVTQLVVLDGTWRKARKLLHLNPQLAALPRVALSEYGVSRYRLRKAPKAGAVSTVEAIVTALNHLECTERFNQLLVPFEALIDRQIQAMGEEVFQRHHGSRP